MSGASDSGACADRAVRESDSELVQTGSVFGYATEGQRAAIADPIRSLSDEDVGQGFFEEAFRPQYNYPSPDAATHGLESPYPTLVLEPEVYLSSAHDLSGSADVDVARRLDRLPELAVVTTTLPSQGTSGSEDIARRSIDHGGNDSGLGQSIGASTPLSAVSKDRHAVAQAIPGLDPHLASTQGEVPHTTNLFPDEAEPYVAGDVESRLQDLLRVTETFAAVAGHGHDRVVDLGFVCKHCGRNCISKHSLSHHVLIHDPSRAHKFVCPHCEIGFMYPNNLERHVESVHNKVRFACADCHKTYARRDGRLRHLNETGHTALDSHAASTSSTVSRQRSHRSPRANPGAPTRSRLPSSSSIRSSTRRAGASPETLGQADQLLGPPYPGFLLSLPTSFTMASVDDTVSTVSDVDSFSL